MSWEIFKKNVLNKLGDPSKVPSIDYVAKVYADEYDNCIKRGAVIIHNITIKKGNKEAMEAVFKAALSRGLTSTEPYDLTGEMGKGVIAYWTGAVMSLFPPPLITPEQIAASATANIQQVSHMITNPGKWKNSSSTGGNKPSQSNNQQSDNNNQGQNNQREKDNSKKILIVGDSISVDAGFTWSSQYKKNQSDKSVDILAKGGEQLSIWMKPQLENKLATNKYDKVYIYGGVNDAFSSKKAENIISSLQTMVNMVTKTGAIAVVIVGYDSEKDMDINKMPTTRYVTKADDYRPLLLEYQKYQNLIPTNISGAKIIPKISLGILQDGFHPYGKQATVLYNHIINN